ncbi:TPA: SIR2 family protein [Klebsiella quasipneumoniae subsp. similipneumoniae]|nr:SIR2 family protein [Klebsiella quasipneumoniae subsp. similipneumoniae]
MDITDKHIRTIVSANNDGNLAIFVGAGVSKSSESNTRKIPDWSELMTELRGELGNYEENDFLKIAQLYFLSFGENVYYSKIKSLFPSGLNPSKIHKTIFDIRPDFIITTNWDDLLEQTVSENAFFYDVVSSDKDLMKSGLKNKLIKMHGDFKNHNIVFKEDDYINYDGNFPLLGNFIKSILSTHVILYVGYSYNDINIKHILKWSQQYTSIRPPMFLAVFKEDEAQRKYLENHGITTLYLSECECNDFDNEYSNKLLTFLNRIKYEEVFKVSGDGEELNDLSCLSFIYERISLLDDMERCFPDQILKALSNCGLLYTQDASAFLRFYSEELTYDYNPKLRKVYSRFKVILNDSQLISKHKKILTNIFSIINKCGLSGVILDDNLTVAFLVSELLTVDATSSESLFNFDYSEGLVINNASRHMKKIKAISAYENKDYGLAYSITSDIIKDELKEKNFSSLLLSVFNYNLILNKLKYEFDSKESSMYKKESCLELNGIYEGFPEKYKKDVRPVLSFVTFEYIYRLNYNVEKFLEKIKRKRASKSIFDISIDMEETRPEFELKTIVEFVVSNCLLIGEFDDFKTVIEKLLKVKFIGQDLRNDFALSRHDLYACIKYFDEYKLKSAIKECYSSEVINLFVDEGEGQWLANTILVNLISLKSKTGNRYGAVGAGAVSSELNNCITLLSYIHLTNEQCESVLSSLLQVLELDNDYLFYRCFIDFLVVKFNSRCKLVDKYFIEKVIALFLEKTVDKYSNEFWFGFFLRIDFSAIYKMACILKAKVKGELLFERLLSFFEGVGATSQVDFVCSHLYYLQPLLSKEDKNKSKAFLKAIDHSKLDETQRIYYELYLLLMGVKRNSDDCLKLLNDYIDRNLPPKASSVLFGFLNIVRFLCKNKRGADFAFVCSRLEDITSTYVKK